MKKNLGLGLMILLAASFAGAATAPQTADFLLKVSSRYYSLSRAGLKNFTCDIHLADIKLISPPATLDPENIKAAHKLKFNLQLDAKGKWNVEGASAAKDQDPLITGIAGSIPAFLMEFLSQCDPYLNGPLFSADDFPKGDYVVEKTTTGFNVNLAMKK